MNDMSVCIIAQNEEKYIGQAIRSIKPFVNEIIVVDHFSDDRTVEISSDLGAKVVQRNWDHDFSKSRNFSILQASSPWILVMDADEEYVDDSNALKEAIRLVNMGHGQAARVGIRSITSQGQVVHSWITRMFPNHPDFRYKGRVHEQLHYKEGYPKVINVPLKFNHYGYSPDEIQRKDKYRRNLDLLLLEHRLDSSNTYLLFQIGKTYGKMNELINSKKWLGKAMDSIEKPYPIFYSTLLLEYANTLMKLKEWGLLSDIINLAIEIYPDYTDLYYIYGSAVIEARNPEWFAQIPEVFSYCIQLGEVPEGKYESVQGVGSFRAHYNLGLFYELTGDISKALYHYEISGQQGFNQANERINFIHHNKK